MNYLKKINKKIILLIIIFLISLGGLFQKNNKYLPTSTNELSFPQSLNNNEIDKIRNKYPISIIQVYKKNRILILKHNDQIIRKYPIRLGFDPVGHKVQEGDGKTPEGRYKIDWRNSKSAFYKSLHISYPNEIDQKNAKNLGVSAGGDIMIHGSAKTIQMKILPSLVKYFPKGDWTLGCIAVRNVDMDEIWELVDDKTIIEIYP